MDIETIVLRLDQEWDFEGFLGGLREGRFPPSEGERFLGFLRSIRIEEDAMLPKRFLSLVWYIPSFLDWQLERVEEQGGDVTAYKVLVTKIVNVLEEVLGIP